MIGSEKISLISEVKKNIESSSASTLQAPQTKKRGCITINDAEEWEEFFVRQNNPATNTTNKAIARRHVHKGDDGMYRYTAEDENKYNGNEIIGKVAEQIKVEISKSIKSGTVKSLIIKESKSEDGSVKPVVRLVLSDNAEEIKMADLLNGDICRKFGVKAVTLCLPDGTRGIRRYVDKNGTKIYEVANGSYKLTLPWTAEGKECFVTIHVYDDGRPVELVDHSDVTLAQLAKLDVNIGMQYDAKPLREMLSSQLERNSLETVRVLESPLTDVTDTTTQKHKVCSACHK